MDHTLKIKHARNAPALSANEASLTPATARRLFREQQWTGPTAGLAAGYVQANMVIVPAKTADAFEAYCRANPKPCPLLERLPAGVYAPRLMAADADIRSDLPRYRVHHAGCPYAECLDVREFWRNDLVAFLLGCSFSFEEAMLHAGLPVRHLEQNCNVPMYRTNRATVGVAPFGGALVVSMRPVPAGRVAEAYRVTQAFERTHGAPVHHGDPTALGIADLAQPEWGDPVRIQPGEVPVFWACGVTSQIALEEALRRNAIDLAIAHAPGHMFITDRRYEELSICG